MDWGSVFCPPPSVTTSTGLEKVRVEILSQNCTLLHECKKGEGRSSAGALIGHNVN